MRQKLYQRLGCFGYHGFGSGYIKGRKSELTGEAYCSRCPVTAECWKKHVERVRALLPLPTEAFERILVERGNNVADAFRAFFERYGVMEPFMMMNVWNLEDGIEVGFDRLPVPRMFLNNVDGSLSWPLLSIEEEIVRCKKQAH